MIDEKMTDEIMKDLLALADESIVEMIKPILDLASPEKVIGKKYDQWTPQDLQRASMAYQLEPDILNKFIAKKEITKLYELEEKVGG